MIDWLMSLLFAPDEQEALVKQTAMTLANQSFVLIDHSKFNKVYFALTNASCSSGVVNPSSISNPFIPIKALSKQYRLKKRY
jgi:DeoR/GlpR family transcriptional regulator of sugar metabolism